MTTYTAYMTCREPVANGFSCDTNDQVSFSHEGETLTRATAESMVNDDTFVSKRCWKCFSQNWRVNSVDQLSSGVSR